MKRFKKIMAGIVIVAAVCVVGTVLWISGQSYTRVIRSNWNIDLPRTGSDEEFAFTEPSFHGDGVRYHVIDYPVGDENGRSRSAAARLESIFGHASQPTEDQIAHVEQLLARIDVEEDVIPDWGKCGLICRDQEDGSELFLFFREETGTVYVVESFI